MEDTILTLAQYSDAIVLRSPEVGSARAAAAVSPVPIINAGDGTGEHPTQALADLLTIQRETGRITNLKIAFVGDLLNGRTVHSLLTLLNQYEGNEFYLISPWLLRLDRMGNPNRIYDSIRGKVAQTFHVQKALDEAVGILEQVDVVYMTRVQRERFTYSDQYAEVKDSCLLTRELVDAMKPEARILHPLPRVNEVSRDIDTDPRAAYFRQVRAGLDVRKALLRCIL